MTNLQKENAKDIILDNIKVVNDCWEWQGKIIGGTGYGYVRFGRISAAHRLSYWVFNGDLIEDLCICHHCDNRKCVNPAHLFQGTAKDNVRDCIKKGRRSANPHKSHAFRLARLAHNLDNSQL